MTQSYTPDWTQKRRNPDVPESLVAVLKKATQQDPGLRHQDAKELLAALNSL